MALCLIVKYGEYPSLNPYWATVVAVLFILLVFLKFLTQLGI